jgi:hypothetical protein
VGAEFVHLGLEGPRAGFVDQRLGADQRLLGARQRDRIGAPELGVGERKIRLHLVVPAVLHPRDRNRRLADQTGDQGLQIVQRAFLGFGSTFAGRLAEGLKSCETACRTLPAEPALGVEFTGYSPSVHQRGTGGAPRRLLSEQRSSIGESSWILGVSEKYRYVRCPFRGGFRRRARPSSATIPAANPRVPGSGRLLKKNSR